MKSFFSIELKHKIDDKRTHHLSVIPANSNRNLIKNERLWFKKEPGYLHCFIEEDEKVKQEIDRIYFWVVCTDDTFYQYTEYPKDITFTSPALFWTNAGSLGEILLERSIEDLIHSNNLQVFMLDKNKETPFFHDAGAPPSNTIGCIMIFLKDIENKSDFSIEFLAKRTIWKYHVYARHSPLKWNYRIEDEGDQDEEGNEGKWIFEQLEPVTQELISFRSTNPIAYQKKATSRLKLIWDPGEEQKFEETQLMTLPFANYAFKTIDGDSVEYTPIYIHI